MLLRYLKSYICNSVAELRFDNSGKNRIPQVNSEVTLLPLQGENDLTRLTRGDADALPRAKSFWAFSPRAKRNKIISIPLENVIATNVITLS